MKKIYLFLLPLVISAASSCSNYGSREITILYTNDVHGALGYEDKALSYASIAKMKQDLKHQGKKVLLFDCGDHTSGGVYCSYLDGLPIVNIMNHAGYDAAIFGNHEFDHTFEMVEAYENLATYPYIATNLYHCEPGDEQQIKNPYTNTSEVFTLGNMKVGVIGVSTPYTMVTSTPSYFKDEDGKIIYSFLSDDDGSLLYDKVQSEVNNLRSNCDYVVCLAHMGGAQGSTELFSSENLVKNTTGIDVVLDGHSHVAEAVKVKNKDNKNVLITQTGSHMNNIGKLTINPQGKITNKLISSYKGRDKTVEALENNVITHIEEEFGTNIATSEINFVAHDDKGWKVRRRETNLGDLCADAFYYTLNEVISKEDENAKCDVAIINSGAVRNDVAAKTWQLLDCRNVHTFDNNVAVKKVDGKTLLLYLEFATRNFKDAESSEDEIGGFPQVQGVSFKIDTSKESLLEVDEKGNFIEGQKPTAGRIVETKVYDKTSSSYVALDETKTDYLVGGSAYILEDYGDGCTMFKKGTSMYRTSSYVDYQVLAEYVKSFDPVVDATLPTISSITSKLKQAYTNLLINYEEGSSRFGAK